MLNSFTTRVTFVFLLFALPGIDPAQAADPLKTCGVCHGKDGNSPKPKSPSISGLSVGYAQLSMQSHREGSRPCGTSKMKCKLVAKYTDEQILAAAQHFSAFPRQRRDQDFDAGLAAKGKITHENHCASCHSSEPADSPELADSSSDGGLLAGQWRQYLEQVLAEYAAGERRQPEEMKAAYAELGDEDKDALLHYYASGL